MDSHDTLSEGDDPTAGSRVLRTGKAAPGGRQVLVDVLAGGVGSGPIDYTQPNLETALREALHVLMGMSEYQLS